MSREESPAAEPTSLRQILDLRCDFYAADGTRMEILGGVYYQGRSPSGYPPAVVAMDSDIRLVQLEQRGNRLPKEQIILRNVRADRETRIGYHEIPTMPVLPLLLNWKE